MWLFALYLGTFEAFFLSLRLDHARTGHHKRMLDILRHVLALHYSRRGPQIFQTNLCLALQGRSKAVRIFGSNSAAAAHKWRRLKSKKQ